jgi:hypothetical protein
MVCVLFSDSLENNALALELNLEQLEAKTKTSREAMISLEPKRRPSANLSRQCSMELLHADEIAVANLLPRK